MQYISIYILKIYFKTISESFEVKNKFITNKINSQSDKRITKKDEIGFTYGMYIFFSYFVMNQFFGVKISQASRDFSLTYSAQSFRKYISRLVNYELKLFLKANLLKLYLVAFIVGKSENPAARHCKRQFVCIKLA